MLVNGKDGIFSIGGTSAPSLRQAAIETDYDLTRSGMHEMKRDRTVTSRTTAETKWRQHSQQMSGNGARCKEQKDGGKS